MGQKRIYVYCSITKSGNKFSLNHTKGSFECGYFHLGKDDTVHYGGQAKYMPSDSWLYANKPEVERFKQ